MKLSNLIRISILIFVVALIGTSQPIAFATTSLKSYEATKGKAFNEIRKATESGSAKNLKLNYEISPSFPADCRKIYVAQARYTSKLVATFLPENEVIIIYFYTEKDASKIAKHEVLSRDSESFQDGLMSGNKGQAGSIIWDLQRGTPKVLRVGKAMLD